MKRDAQARGEAMESNLPDDVKALRAILLEQAHKLASVYGEIKRLKAIRLSSATDLRATPNNLIPISPSRALSMSRPRWRRGEVASEAMT